MTPMSGNKPSMILFLCLLLLVFSSCGNKGDISAASGDIPDTVSENFRQVTVSSSGRAEIESRRVETFNKKELTVFTNASVKEFDADGASTLEGRADRIETTGNGDGSASGGIFVRDIPGDSRLKAEHLDWDDQDRLLTGTGIVDLETGDGLAVQGEGFVADMARETFSFSEGAEGILSPEEKNTSGPGDGDSDNPHSGGELK